MIEADEPSTRIRAAADRLHVLDPAQHVAALRDLMLGLASDLRAHHPFPSGGWLAALRWANVVHDGHPGRPDPQRAKAQAAHAAGWVRENGEHACTVVSCASRALYRLGEEHWCKRHCYESLG